jgi:K+-transporting ATPase ATPase A chain
MTAFIILQPLLYLLVLLLVVKPCGAFMARVYQGERTFLSAALQPLERFIYRVAHIGPNEEMGWKTYAVAVLLFNFAGILLLYLIQRLQAILPLNPQGLIAVPPGLAFNTAVSFVTNTNWQSYSGETTMTYLTQMLGLTVQNFLSAATGMAVLIALVRSFSRQSAKAIGNFWVDTTRSVLYILLPLSLVLAMALVSQGVVQTFNGSSTVHLLQSTHDSGGQIVNEQVIAVGPVASQEAIKQLGTNGGGFFNVN